MYKVGVIALVFVFGILTGSLCQKQLAIVQAGVGGPLASCQDINGDGVSNVTDAVFFLNWLFLGGAQPECQGTSIVARVPDSSQMRCYNDLGAEIDCNGETCIGQDGFYDTGCPPEGRFTDNADSTLTDSCTGLMWQKISGNSGKELDWCSALAYCESLEFAGHDDWRLPSLKELLSIVDFGRAGPASDSLFDFFPDLYWSSTSYELEPEYAWGISFVDGYHGMGDKKGTFTVRAVRDALQ